MDIRQFQLNFDDSKYLELQNTPGKGRAVIAKIDIPECTDLIVEDPLFFYDPSKHPPSILSCETCLNFYNDLNAAQKEENKKIEQQLLQLEKKEMEKKARKQQKQEEKQQEKEQQKNNKPTHSQSDSDLKDEDYFLNSSITSSSDSDQEQSDNEGAELTYQNKKNSKKSRNLTLIYSEAIKEIQNNFQGHLGYIHLMAEILQSPENHQNLFLQLDFCPTNLSQNQNLEDTKNFLLKHKFNKQKNEQEKKEQQNNEYDKKQVSEKQNDDQLKQEQNSQQLKQEQDTNWSLQLEQIFDRLVSNSQGQTDPPVCGTYMKTSMLNHSCKNNCFYFIENQKMTVRNFKKINKGEEVTISYIRNLYQPRILRQKELAYRGFKCVCERCSQFVEEVRVWNCPNPEQKCEGEFLNINNMGDFQCKLCGYETNYLQEAKMSEKNIDINFLNKKHFKLHQDMDKNLQQNGFSIPEELYESLSLQLIKNFNELFETNHYPENISLYDVIGQRYNKEKNLRKAKHYFMKAYEESVACFGPDTQQAQFQLERVQNPPQQCSIF
ncbi:hypothetical protein PPERSA_08618 [Pseudocohnilembus persalinus]|uniref:SET domain-containing protein n=1 Tax=Pseudocohnilembus persalinus TaxID=266149 RepID=A0A0V0R521_PSEPJ|nr:hypothetical protein PPERSA_08618 [Pseudocohnilembus persalinus]|eukprot:KRX09586.1 hypothetical protein PPERSA_08618 [Pseudocohnilembus persalinus]